MVIPGTQDQQIEFVDIRFELLNSSADRFRVGDVHLTEPGTAPVRCDPLRVLAGSGVVLIVGEDNLSAFFRQSQCNRCTYSTGCARDQCNFVIEFKIYASPGRLYPSLYPSPSLC